MNEVNSLSKAQAGLKLSALSLFKKRFNLGERAIAVLLASCAMLSIATTAGIVFLLGSEALQFFRMVSVFDFLFGTRWEPLLEPQSFGVLPLLCGTFLIVFGAAIIALPLGLLTAVYLSEYASFKARSLFKPLLEILAGIPTVVYGYFALSFVTPILQKIFPQTEVFNAASGAIVVGIMIMPIISSLCDDAFQSIPVSLREAGYAMGATSSEVVLQIVLRAASPRVLAAVVLALSRAIGETMAVTLAAGATPKLTLNPLESIQTVTAFIVQVSLGDTPAGGVEYLTCFGVGALLFVITLVLNQIAQHFLFRAPYRGSL